LVTSPGKRLKRDTNTTDKKKQSSKPKESESALVKVVDEVEVEEDDDEEEESDDEDILEGFESGSEVDEAQLSLSLPAIPKPKQVSSITQTSTEVATVSLSDSFDSDPYP